MPNENNNELEDSSTSVNQQEAPETITRVAIRIPPFWHEKPQIWFAQIEAQFQTAKIVRDSSKFNTIIGAIESQVLTQVSDAVLNPPSENKYENLKTVIIERFGDSEQRKIKKLLSEVDLGDKRPSQLLNELKELGGNHIADEFLKSLWLQRLPTQVRAILQASGEELTALSKLADKIMEVGDFSQVSEINAVQRKATHASQSQASSNELSLQQLQQEIQTIGNQLNQLIRKTRDISNHRSRSSSSRIHSLK